MVDKIKTIFSDYKYKSFVEIDNTNLQQGLSKIQENEPQVIDIYLSERYDELFLIVDARDCEEIYELCEEIDRKIVSFINFGCDNKETVLKLKYNIIQIVLHASSDISIPFKDSLSISRKIRIDCSDNREDKVQRELLKLPFNLQIERSTPDISIEKQELAELLKGGCEFLFTIEDDTEESVDNFNEDDTEESIDKSKLVDKRIDEIREWLSNANNNC